MAQNSIWHLLPFSNNESELELMQPIMLDLSSDGDVRVMGRLNLKTPNISSPHLLNGATYLTISGSHMHVKMDPVSGSLHCISVARNKNAARLNGRTLSTKEFTPLQEGDRLALVLEAFLYEVKKGPPPTGQSYSVATSVVIQGDPAEERGHQESSQCSIDPATNCIIVGNNAGGAQAAVASQVPAWFAAPAETPVASASAVAAPAVYADAKMVELAEQQQQQQQQQQQEAEKAKAKATRLAAQLECPICTMALAFTHVTKCGHSFCYECLHQHAHFVKSNRLCPTCSQTYVFAEIAPAYIIDNMVEHSLAAEAAELQDWQARARKGKNLQRHSSSSSSSSCSISSSSSSSRSGGGGVGSADGGSGGGWRKRQKIMSHILDMSSPASVVVIMSPAKANIKNSSTEDPAAMKNEGGPLIDLTDDCPEIPQAKPPAEIKMKGAGSGNEPIEID